MRAVPGASRLTRDDLLRPGSLGSASFSGRREGPPGACGERREICSTLHNFPEFCIQNYEFVNSFPVTKLGKYSVASS